MWVKYKDLSDCVWMSVYASVSVCKNHVLQVSSWERKKYSYLHCQACAQETGSARQIGGMKLTIKRMKWIWIEYDKNRQRLR